MANAHLLTAWLGFLGGILSGAAIGMFFRDQAWLGGYDSWPRRMLRLGHIACFGIGFLNLSMAVTLGALHWPAPYRGISMLLVAANVLMPAVCFASAWRPKLAALFPLPVLCTVVPVVAVIVRRLMS